jgi:hypothetical protein
MFVFLNGQTPAEDRAKEKQVFEDRVRKGVIATRIWNEGVNIKSIGAVINAVGGTVTITGDCQSSTECIAVNNTLAGTVNIIGNVTKLVDYSNDLVYNKQFLAFLDSLAIEERKSNQCRRSDD